MKVWNIEDTMEVREGVPAPGKEHRPPAPPIPPHERRGRLRLELEDRDWAAMREIFGDEDTAAAAAEILREAPPEIQILAIQLLHLIEEAA